ncbi:MAG: hypothetical protein B7Z80_20825 [Rhodospirillales bacterium 20-64-7]|nr:MAG: hypothetical protein B7Z80_20825 [Rhodospirillales bacterium 20-64-7]HQT77900.1 glycosyltransferase family 4 protein [Rhodopila sp.]
MAPNKSILFVKLGHFSYTNDAVALQLARNFPDHTLLVADVKTLARRSNLTVARNLLEEVTTFGPSVLRNRVDLHAYFFRTPFIFRRLNQMVNAEYGPMASELSFVIQTQGLFSGRIPGVPHLIYTDYTFKDNLDEPEHDTRQFRSRTFLRYEADLYRTADAVATTGSHVERTLINRYGCDPARVRTVHIGANVRIEPVATDLARYAARHVLFVGVEWERKGGPALVEAFTRVARDYPDARLTIVGCSPAVSHPQITVAGRIARDRMPTYFKGASLLCMPSIIEPLGIAAIEASLFRMPVIATRIGGFFETVTDEETGILVPPNDPAALEVAMRRLFEDPALMARMGEAGFNRNRVLFDWDEVGKRLRDVAWSIAPGLRAAA